MASHKVSAIGLDAIETDAGQPVDVLIDNAGVPGRHEFLEAAREDTDRVFAPEHLPETDEGRDLVDHIAMKRLGKLEEPDGMPLPIASEPGSFMTGSVVAVDGGHLVPSL